MTGPATRRAAGRAGACLLALLILAAPATAQERIHSYDSEIDIREDGSIEVVERIRVRAEGQQIRRGIYRDFPTRYRDRYGNRVRVDFELLGVERNGVPEPSFTERRPNGIRVNTGGDAFLPVPADYTFTLRYRTTRQLGFFDAHDELYWNAIGTGWVFPIQTGTVEVRLPSPVPPGEMRAEAYTGPEGAQGAAYAADTPAPGVATFRLTQPLAPREGLTIVLTFPKGIVAAPSAAQRAGWLLRDNRGVLVALGGAVLFGLFCVSQWRRFGRDPRPGVIIPRYVPPDGQTPAGLRYVRRMGYDTRCFSSDLLSLAVAGHLHIDRDKRLFKDRWSIERRDPGPGAPAPTPSQRALLTRLLPPGTDSLVLEKKHATTISGACDAHRKRLDADHHPRHFHRHSRLVTIATVIAAVSMVAAIWAANGYGIPSIIAIGALMLIGLFVFQRLIRAPTADGRALLDEIDGLKRYLSVAERDELAGLEGPGGPPPLDERRYETLLPFAVALEVEEAWTRKFTAAVGAAAAAAAASHMAWYSGHGGSSDLRGFTHSLGSSLSSQIASASSPPGSSSGGGGGGSSGGGGGGGGGGGR